MKKLLSLTRRAIDDYNMIQKGDKVAVLISGGKDSLGALYALWELKKFYPKDFELIALTLDMGFEGADYSAIIKKCGNLGIEYHIKKSNLADILFNIRKEKNPCSLCAKMRRGMLSDLAKLHGCNKVALGHHLDDAVETFFLSLFYEGRIYCFSPVTYLSRADITQIRPLIYMYENDITSFANKEALPVAFNPCPASNRTKREEIKNIISNLEKSNPKIKSLLFGAIKRSNISGW